MKHETISDLDAVEAVSPLVVNDVAFTAAPELDALIDKAAKQREREEAEYERRLREGCDCTSTRFGAMVRRGLSRVGL
jgi:hypothetical protein